MWFKELGLNHYKARIYSPKLGRFLDNHRNGAKAGAAAGVIAGVAVAGACDGTAGVCALGNPAIVAGATALGAVVGESIERAYVQLERLVAKATTDGP